MFAKGSITLIVAFLIASCGVGVRLAENGFSSIKNSALFHSGRHGQLTEIELLWATTAWRYFKNNTMAETGLANSIDNFPSTTMSSVADYLAALVAAHEFEFVSDRELDYRISNILLFLNAMPLFYGRLPNKVYNTKTGAMARYDNAPGEIGWSAIDLGRLLIWLNIVSQRYPHFNEYIDKAVLRWNFCDVISEKGSLYSGTLLKGKIKLHQEGRLGYEEYASMGFRAWGFNPKLARLLTPAEFVTIYNIDIYHDARDTRKYGALTPVLSLPHTLMGIEFNWDHIFDADSLDSTHTDSLAKDAALRVYEVQKRRYYEEKIFTARTEHILNRAPFFLYDSVFANGYAWNTISDDGKTFPQLSLVAVKAAFQMWALWPDAYTDELMLVVRELYDDNRGWYEGRYEVSGGYEKSISSSTNAAVLEALLYKHSGKLFKRDHKFKYGRIRMGDIFKHPGRCFPEIYSNDAALEEVDVVEKLPLSSPEKYSPEEKFLKKTIDSNSLGK